MYPISPTQIKAARAILGWLQDDLARASGLSVTTLRALEAGHISPRSAEKVRKTLEKSGVEFIEDDGVKRRNDQIKIYRGSGSREKFLENMLETLKETGGDILCFAKSQDLLLQTVGTTSRDRLKPLQALSQVAGIKCLLCDGSLAPIPYGPSLQFRVAPRYVIGSSPCYIFGDKYAYVVHEGQTGFSFVVFDFPIATRDLRNHFLSTWDSASPVPIPFSPPEPDRSKHHPSR